MSLQILFKRRINLTFLVALFLTACGGSSGSGGADTGGPPPPPPPKSISGVVMLGPVADADVEISGTTGSLGSTVTDADGRFGPISYSGSYNGPLRITVTGNTGSTWICDFRLGCGAGNDFFQPGDSITFDGTLEAVLPSATDGQFVSVSLLSNFAAERLDIIGDLTTANVNAANDDVAAALRLLLGDVFTDLSVTLPDEFNTIELIDLANVSASTGSHDALTVILSLFNSALVALNEFPQTTGEFIDSISNDVATQPQLSISSAAINGTSQESFLVVFVVQAIQFFEEGGPVLDAINLVLAPATLNSVIDIAIGTFLDLPALDVGMFELGVGIDANTIPSSIVHELPVFTTTGTELQAGDYDVRVIPIDGGDWVSATAVMIGSAPHVRIEFDDEIIAGLPNGTYESIIEIYSVTGEFRRHDLSVFLHINSIVTEIHAGPDTSGNERSTVDLLGYTNNPEGVESITWVQTAGPAVMIANGDSFQPSITLPSVESDQLATLRLDVDFNTGASLSDSINILIHAFPNIADVTLNDSVLQQCVDDAADTGGLVEIFDLTSVECSGVSDLTGFSVFSEVTSLNLAGNSLSSLQEVLSLSTLQLLDISGNSSLSCDEIDLLAERLEEGTALLVDDICLGNVDLDLGANGIDAALDVVRAQVYVSLPDRNEITVVSLEEQRIVDRLQLPGSPYGIDLSIDGTRLFAALNGSNAVAEIDIESRTVSTIGLGDSTDHPTTYDVVEAETDRLFVSANPGSSGLSYIVQVRLDQGNATSRVANNTIIRSRPVLALSPDQQFVYVGSGFSPNSLYKLSLSDPAAGIVLEDDHGSVGGTDNLTLNAAGTRIALRSGQVLRTGSFVEQGRVPAGRSVASSNSNTLFVAGSSGRIESFDFGSLDQIEAMETGCTNGTTSRILAYDSDSSFLLLQDGIACIYTSLSRNAPVDPLAALRFPDLAFEECVIAAATNFGFTDPEEFTELNCSANSRTILGLEGIDRLANLQTLDLSNSSVADLSPLAAMNSLQSLSMRDANLSDISAVFAVASLTSVDLSGNPGVVCADLDQLVSTGVAVTADQCTETVVVELGGIGHDMEYDVAGNRLFVSVPSLNRVSEINLATGSIAQNFGLSSPPRGIDLSDDMQTLYAALHGAGDVAVINSLNGATEVIDISVELDDDRTWDIAEVSSDRIVVSANPSSSGISYIVEVRRDLGNAATRVASNRIIRAAPIIEVSPDQMSVYVGEGFSPNSLYKLDAAQANMPIVLEDDHGEVSGTYSLAVSPDSARVYLASGQVFSATTLNQVAQFPPGRSVVSEDGSKLLIADEDTDTAYVHDIQTTGQVAARRWGCKLINLTAIEEFGDGVIVLGDDLVCFSRTVAYP